MKKQRLITPYQRSMFETGYRVMQGSQEFVTYQEDTTIRVWYASEPDHYSEHSHSSVEVILPHCGTCTCVVNGVEHVVRDTEVMFIPPHTPHTLSMPKESIRNLILFDLDALTGIRGFNAILPMAQEIIHLTDEHALCGEVRSQLFAMMDQYYRKPPLMNLVCYTYLLHIYTMMGQAYMAQHSEEIEAPHRREDSSWTAINRVVEYINQFYAQPITLESIAGVAGFSKYYFSRLFAQHTGTSFSQYLLRKRIAVAAHLLCSTQLSMVDVSLQSGFTSLSTFNRTFKAMHGCTPTEYRAIYEKGGENDHTKA